MREVGRLVGHVCPPDGARPRPPRRAGDVAIDLIRPLADVVLSQSKEWAYNLANRFLI